MARIIPIIFILGLINWLGSCSSPGRPASGTYPQDPRISTPAGVPRDSATSYFPASASVNPSQDSLAKRMGDCQGEFQGASELLFRFKAPVLSNYYFGHSIYRFLWWPAFRLPVLLTLDLTESKAVLKTQCVNRYPEPMASARQVEAESRPEIERINQLKALIKTCQQVADNQERLASALSRLDYIKLSGTPLIITEKNVVLSQSQVRQFVQLLNQADFWQLPSCKPTFLLDGAYYTLEAHELQRYKVVMRHSPSEKDGFFRCCKFLLDLSPAKP
ncbi:hypothetical protein [Hymenobacter properus]|uniref:Lipoprotein n=1 Tax=Hymenobacter properus TaxID=2791026 RepID=A0A931FJV7_9BACT|nr:hypothetical protein [Hymenobacter properus]MBF9142333.1 hypothetical protein [Hymenobacter properus]MBR7721140.1 hypothetical protein [Microvirga sp. SRT04]